jgi:hypothetical protein
VVDLLAYLLFLPIYQMTQKFKKGDMLLLLSKILFNFISASAFHQLIILKIIHRFTFNPITNNDSFIIFFALK